MTTRMKLLLLLVAVSLSTSFSALLFPAGAAAQGAPQETWCADWLYPRIAEGGTWFDPNIVVELYRPYYPGDIGVDAWIFHLGYPHFLAYHGSFNGIQRWGVSTRWAIYNPTWSLPYSWWIVYRCPT
jgi:hypothetical protein